jgi:hypothetical protein
MDGMCGGNPNPVNGTKNLIHRGRFKGAQGKYTRVLRQAIVYATERSKNSKSKDLDGYCLFLADEKPELFVVLLARLFTMQAKRDEDEFHYSDINPKDINPNMPVSEMISVFAARIREPE